jgi:hypothetical protein
MCRIETIWQEPIMKETRQKVSERGSSTRGLGYYRGLAGQLFVGGMLLLGGGRASALVHYVDANGNSPAPPYTDWSTASANIQEAINISAAGDEIVVTNGIYEPIQVGQQLIVRSINGPLFTSIDGAHHNRCASLADGASLSGFTLTNGFQFDYGAMGGGVYGGTLNNCILISNSVYWASARMHNDVFGGGAVFCTLNKCVLNGNSAVGELAGDNGSGGGAYACTLNNCILVGNVAAGAALSGFGGGAYSCALNNCTLTGNRGDIGSGAADSTLNNCIILDNTTFSTLNHCWTADPLFVDFAAGNLRLQSNSPCINAGLNALAPPSYDLDGDTRVVGGTVDIGAYEFQSPTSVISYAWLQQYGLPKDGSADFADPDGDGMNNWQEWRSGTDPTNSVSALRLLSSVRVGTSVTVTWQSVEGVSYVLERSASLGPATFTPVAMNIPGQPGTTSYIDTIAVGDGAFFYRVGALLYEYFGPCLLDTQCPCGFVCANGVCTQTSTCRGRPGGP